MYLVATDVVHFDVDNYGSSGVFITTPRVTVKLRLTSMCRELFVNQSAKARKIELVTNIEDAAGKVIAQKKTAFKTVAGEKISFVQQFTSLANPMLWSPEHPYLYQNNHLIDRCLHEAAA